MASRLLKENFIIGSPEFNKFKWFTGAKKQALGQICIWFILPLGWAAYQIAPNEAPLCLCLVQICRNRRSELGFSGM